jgi:hypothetical protein
VDIERLWVEKTMDVAVWAAGPGETPIAAHIAAFRAAYPIVRGLEGDDDEWTAVTLEAAWDMVKAARPRGTSLDRLLVELETAHAAIVETAARPAADRRAKPRRDA